MKQGELDELDQSNLFTNLEQGELTSDRNAHSVPCTNKWSGQIGSCQPCNMTVKTYGDDLESAVHTDTQRD